MKPNYTQVGNVVLVGTSHIAQESVKNVAATIDKFAPCIVGVELDRPRFRSLISKEERGYPLIDGIRKFGVKGYLFALIASYFSKKMAKMVGANPGDDMLSAIMSAKKKDLRIALLDQPIQITLRRFSSGITWREKGRFVIDAIRGLLFPKREMKRYGLEAFDLTKVPSEKIIEKMVGYMRLRYPSLYRVLIEERNAYMVRKIRKFCDKYPEETIVVVIGAGHKKGMLDLLSREG